MPPILSLAFISFLVLGGCTIVSPQNSEPSWQRVSLTGLAQPNLDQENRIELRDYDSMLIAEVTMTGTREAAINNGFKVLADYIFGNNGANTKLAMTTPVLQTSASLKPPLPSITSLSDDNATTEWLIRFVMPSGQTLGSLPTPNDRRIRLLMLPAMRVAVIRFSGRHTASQLDKQQQLLFEWLQANQLQARGAPAYAFYDPPWTLPFLRRNEIMVGLQR